jgi:hypothetical protein
MEPISTAIIAAITAGLTEAGKDAVIDAYKGLKALIARKFGGQSTVAEAVTALEKAPDSKGRQMTLHEELVTVKAEDDSELKHAAEGLLELLKARPGGLQRVQQVAKQIGDYNSIIQISGSGNRVGSLGGKS